MKLVVYKHDIKLTEYNLDSEVGSSDQLSFQIGRSENCLIQLDDSKLSRQHATLDFQSGIWTIKKTTDYGSMICKSKEITELIIEKDTEIQIGLFQLSFFITKEESVTENNSQDDGDETELLSPQNEEMEDPNSNSSDQSLEEEGEKEVNQNDDEYDEFAISDEDTQDGFEIEQSDDLSDSSEEHVDDFDVAVDDEDFGDSGSDDESGESTQVLQLFSKVELNLNGEFAPFENFMLKEAETFIGRDPEKCQIILKDPEVSSIHAVLRKNNLSIELEDLESANGTILNGKSIKNNILNNNDEFIIGSTTFSCKVSSSFHNEEKDRLMPVEVNQTIEVEEIIEVDESDFLDDEVEGDSSAEPAKGIQAILKDPAKRKKLLIYGVVLMALWFMMGDEEPKAKKRKKSTKKTSRLLGDQKKESDKQKFLKKLSPQQLEKVETSYLIANSLFKSGKYDDSMRELEKIFALINDYKKARQIYALSKEAMKRFEELARKEKAEKERRARDLKVKQLIVKATEAVNKKNIQLAKGLFGKVLEIDPENFDVTQLKMELDSYIREEERKRVEKAMRKAELQRQRDDLSPGKNAYLRKEWFVAIGKLDKFLMKKNLDPEFITEASRMLNESRDNLERELKPIIGKARSLKEGQDLKGAYEQYKLVLEFDPSNVEALNQKNAILEELDSKSKRLYREAIISESLILFEDAKQKLQEVQQISPSDSEYYKKSTEKLKNFY